MPYRPPTPAQVEAFLRRHALTAATAAAWAYLSGGQAVRKYTCGVRSHRLSGAIWFAWHARALLPPEDVARIEAAMQAGASGRVGAEPEPEPDVIAAAPAGEESWTDAPWMG